MTYSDMPANQRTVGCYKPCRNHSLRHWNVRPQYRSVGIWLSVLGFCAAHYLRRGTHSNMVIQIVADWEVNPAILGGHSRPITGSLDDVQHICRPDSACVVWLVACI